MSFNVGTSLKAAKRSDIQILRGIAVLAVVLYHFDVPYLTGGFLGVDIFFVISGFVITEALLRTEGSFKARIKHFYIRRARRILPAAIFVGIVTLLGSVFFLPRPYLGRYVFDALCSFFMVSNAGFTYQDMDYFTQSLSPSPYLHYWSLAVEEQFYLVWPLVLILFVKNRRWILYIALPMLTILAIMTTAIKPGFSYYSPSSRAWEFLAGAILVFLPKQKLARLAYRFAILISSIALVTSLFVVNQKSATPGISTALPVFSAAVLIYLGFGSRGLSSLSWVGDISYSLYLVHWPIIVMVASMYGDISTLSSMLLLVLCVVLAKVVSIFVESPFRFESLAVARRKALLASSLSFSVVFAMALTSGFFSSGGNLSLVIDTSAPAVYYKGCHVSGAEPKIEGCFFGDLSAERTVMLVGDSHASQYFPALDDAARAANYKLLSTTKSACPAVSLGDKESNRDRECLQWQNKIIALIKNRTPNILVIANFTERNDGQASLEMSPTEFAAAFDDFIAQVRGSVGKIVYIGDSPFAGDDALSCLQRNRRQISKCDLPNTKEASTKIIEAHVKKLGLEFIDSRTFLCGSLTCKSVLDGKNVYKDASHISVHISGIVQKGLAGIFR